MSSSGTSAEDSDAVRPGSLKGAPNGASQGQLADRPVQPTPVPRHAGGGWCRCVSLPGILAACGGSLRRLDRGTPPPQRWRRRAARCIRRGRAHWYVRYPALFSTFADLDVGRLTPRGVDPHRLRTAKATPEPASSWDVSSDGRTYMFTIRDNATFHDGSPVTAKDFERTWQRMFNPDDPTVAPGGYGALLLGAPNTHSFKALPDGRFQVNLVRADVSFPAKAGVQAGAVLSAAQIEKDGKKVGEKPIGSRSVQARQFSPRDRTQPSRPTPVSGPALLSARQDHLPGDLRSHSTRHRGADGPRCRHRCSFRCRVSTAWAARSSSGRASRMCRTLPS